MYNKISPSLLNIVSVQNKSKQVDCIVYAKDFMRLSKVLANKKVVQKYPFINAFGVRLSYKNIFDLIGLEEVKYITQSVRVSAQIKVSKEIMNVPINVQNAQFSIAIIDTGVYPHIDIVGVKNPIIKWLDLVNNKAQIYDDNGHGTFVTGVICGKGIVSNGKYSGMDISSNIISIKALDKNGETGAGTILSAMQWVYDNRKKYNIRIVCMSFGSNAIGENDPLIKGAERLWDSGIVVVCAGGNSGPESDTIKSPGASSKVITVGSINDNRVGEYYDVSKFEVADFSSRGPANNRYKPDIVAPGVEIVGLANFKLDGAFYAKMSGTSVSTPMIVSMCSKVLKEHPSYSPDMVKRYILNKGVVLNGNRNSEGYGWFRW